MLQTFIISSANTYMKQPQTRLLLFRSYWPTCDYKSHPHKQCLKKWRAYENNLRRRFPGHRLGAANSQAIITEICNYQINLDSYISVIIVLDSVRLQPVIDIIIGTKVTSHTVIHVSLKMKIPSTLAKLDLTRNNAIPIS